MTFVSRFYRPSVISTKLNFVRASEHGISQSERIVPRPVHGACFAGLFLLLAGCAAESRPSPETATSDAEVCSEPKENDFDLTQQEQRIDYLKEFILFRDCKDWERERYDTLTGDAEARPRRDSGNRKPFPCKPRGEATAESTDPIESPLLTRKGQTLPASLVEKFTVRWEGGTPPYQVRIVQEENGNVLLDKQEECLVDPRGFEPIGELDMRLEDGFTLSHGLYRFEISDEEDGLFRQVFEIVAAPEAPAETISELEELLHTALLIEKMSPLEAYILLSEFAEANRDVVEAQIVANFLARGEIFRLPALAGTEASSTGETGQASN